MKKLKLYLPDGEVKVYEEGKDCDSVGIISPDSMMVVNDGVSAIYSGIPSVFTFKEEKKNIVTPTVNDVLNAPIKKSN